MERPNATSNKTGIWSIEGLWYKQPSFKNQGKIQILVNQQADPLWLKFFELGIHCISKIGNGSPDYGTYYYYDYYYDQSSKGEKKHIKIKHVDIQFSLP